MNVTIEDSSYVYIWPLCIYTATYIIVSDLTCRQGVKWSHHISQK